MGGTERDAASWPWPPELDGPIAAPVHHQVIFENERVRVLENTGDDDLIVIGVELKGADIDAP